MRIQFASLPTKGDLEMETTYKWLRQKAACVGLFGVLLAASGTALADRYNIILKQDGVPVGTCAMGGFSFTKTTTTTTGSASSFSLQITGPCIGLASGTSVTLNNPSTFNGVVVQDPVSTTGESQGLSVEGLNGTITDGGNGNNQYKVTFSTSGTAVGIHTLLRRGTTPFVRATTAKPFLPSEPTML